MKSFLIHRNLAQTFPHGPMDMKGHAKKDVERYCQLATTQQLHKETTPCFDDHQFKEEEMGAVGKLSKMFSTCPEMPVFSTHR